MFGRKKKERTAKEQANRAQMNVFARLGGCVFLIYFVVQLLGMSEEDGGPSATLKIIIAIVFIGATVAIAAVTGVDFYRSYKAGVYDERSYMTAEERAAADAEAEEIRARDEEREAQEHEYEELISAHAEPEESGDTPPDDDAENGEESDSKESENEE